MKYVKMLILAAVLGGLVFAGFTLKSGPDDPSIIIPAESDPLEYVNAKIDELWDKDVTEWNAESYRDSRNLVAAYKSELGDSYELAVTYHDQKVRDCLVALLNGIYGKNNCSRSKISNLKEGFYAINGQLPNDSRLKDALYKISTYEDVLTFGRKSYDLSPQFIYPATFLSDFTTYRDEIKKKRNVLEEKVKDCCGGKDAKIEDKGILMSLDTARVDEVLRQAEKKYAEALSDAIIRAYKSAFDTGKDSYSKLKDGIKDAVGKYQYSNFVLTDFKTKFIDECEKAEKEVIR